MDVSVILCTYNRCQELAKALESLAASTMPESLNWEVLVVDNNSRDHTPEVVSEFARRYPGRFRYLFEGQPGKSYALNAGIYHVRGDIVAFVDDDVVVDNNWLQNLCAPLLSGEWVGVGGPVLPQDEGNLPKWIKSVESCARGPLVMFDLGRDRIDLTEAPFGTNMAFTARMFAKHGGFRTDLGPRPGSEIRGEDSEFFFRLLAAGEKLCYEPSALVYHAIPEKRITKKYFLEWWFDKGRCEIRTAGVPVEDGNQMCGVPTVWFRRLAAWAMRSMFSLESSRRMFARTRLHYVGGRITEAYTSWRFRKSSGSSPKRGERLQSRVANESADVQADF